MLIGNKFRVSLLFCVVLGLIALFCPTSILGQAVQQQDAVGYGMTSGRLVASLSAVVGLIGVVIGVLTLVRPTGFFGTATGRLGAIITLASGLIAAGIGGFRVATVPGGFGTGGGRAGAIVAVVLGLIAIALGGLALSRSGQVQPGSQ